MQGYEGDINPSALIMRNYINVITNISKGIIAESEM
jgi:hypothetical protein